MASYSGYSGLQNEPTKQSIETANVQKETIGVLVEQITQQVIDIKAFTQDVLKVKLSPVTSIHPPKPEDNLKKLEEQVGPSISNNILGLLRVINMALANHHQELSDIVDELDL